MALDVRMSPLGPVVFVGPGALEGLALVRAHGGRLSLPLGELQPARLWLAKGRDWTGPLEGWSEALERLEGLCPAPYLPDVRKALEPALTSELGAHVIAGGWRYRLAWGNDFPPERFSSA